MTAPHLDPARRHDFVLFFDVTDGNPNGDPDAGNLPRVDPETMRGLVTDVAIKRKVRNWVDIIRGGESCFKIYVQSGVALNAQHRRAYQDLGLESKGNKQPREEVERARAWMCQNFYDIRMFGAVMGTGVNCGQVRGPVQLTLARSIDPVVPLDLSITRIAVTREEDAGLVTGDNDGEGKSKQTEMGRKPILPYGLYRTYGFFTPHFASQTGVTEEDLELLWQALQQMWDLDHSAARGLMGCQGLYVFSHADGLGNASANTLFRRVQVERRDGIAASRSFDDYKVTLDENDLPAGVMLTSLCG
jgi:CRISPR-associated protein Csd2